MSFSQSAASNIVPLLARLVLAAVFIPAGYHKVMDDADFSGGEAKRLRELNVVASAAEPPIQFASLVQNVPTAVPTAAPPTAPAAAPTSTPSKPTTDESPTPAASGTPVAPGGEPLKARQLHRVTLMVDKMGWQYPVVLGWVAALTELVGGVLILVGLFSRIWALGLAITMAIAFQLTSIASYTSTSGYFHEMPISDYTRFAAQAALFALAFGVVLTGAGGFSLDRVMFRGGSPHAGNTGGKKAADD
ncbi:MAG: DoxX family protein [Phycisphaerae bacterium]|nr:DoxX family protein [Phycisphaerae bacterium]